MGMASGRTAVGWGDGEGGMGGDGKRSNRCWVGVGGEEDGWGWQAVEPLSGGRMEKGEWGGDGKLSNRCGAGVGGRRMDGDEGRALQGRGEKGKGRGKGEEGEARKPNG